MKSLSKDARGFVDGVVHHLKQNGTSETVTPKVQSLLLKMSSQARKEHEARVESAVKLSPAEMTVISRVLSRIAGHDVSLTSDVTPSLIGGIRVTMGDWVVDSSLSNELAEMAHMVNES